MNRTITRFTSSERWLHNIVMLTFLSLLMTGLGMLYYNLMGNQGPSRQFLVSVHKVVSVAFIAGPVLAIIFGARKIWKENFRLLTTWKKEDFEWLAKKPFAAIFKGIELPEDDKFNPGQKSWAALAVSGSLMLAVSGIYMWVTGSPILALFVHTLLAIALAGALSGHVYMAIGNKATRPSISSIIDGQVDVHWAAEHHPLWMERLTKERVLDKAAKQSSESISKVSIAAVKPHKHHESGDMTVKINVPREAAAVKKSAPIADDLTEAKAIKIPRKE